MSKYGICNNSNCQTNLKPIWFKEDEYKTEYGRMVKTGRKRTAVDVLVCPNCLKEYCVDDSFDEPWEY